MNITKRDFYIKLHGILETNPPRAAADSYGKTTREIKDMYNQKHNDRKNIREIAAGLTFLVRRGYAFKRITSNVTRWRPITRDIYRL